MNSNLALSFLSLVFYFAFWSNVNAQIFVKKTATGNNDGSSWENAFIKLQPALDLADTGDQIWIAAGTYIPEGPSADSSHFFVKKGVAIYGGFNGTESMLEDRELWKDTTTISGDILGDDMPSDFSINRSDNAHHVLIIDGGDHEAILDGIVFSGGSTRLDEYEPDSIDSLYYDRWSGGALYILNTSVMVKNCIFKDNIGFLGSGLFAMYNNSSLNNLKIETSLYVQNWGHMGAGIYLDSKNSVEDIIIEIESCLFNSNISSAYDNAYGGGGAIRAIGNYSTHNAIILRNSDFLKNFGRIGGAIDSHNQNWRIEKCKFERNLAEGVVYIFPFAFGGSAIYFSGEYKDLKVLSTIFNDNIDKYPLGSVCLSHGNASFENVLFYGNSGSAIQSYVNFQLLNSTIVENGAGLFLNNAEIQNCIFKNEGKNLTYLQSAELVSKGGNISSDSTMSQYLNGYSGYKDLHQTDPLLGPDFIPLFDSPCIDAGNPEGVTATYDLASNSRQQGNGIDAGAYESPFTVAVKDAVWDSQDVHVFPNPVQDFIHIELESDWMGDLHFTIFNLLGQPVYESALNKLHRIQSFSENISLLSPGEYAVLIKAGKNKYAKKIFIQN